MIAADTTGYETEIRSLLTRAWNWNVHAVDAWMASRYDPKNMYAIFINNKIAALIQTRQQSFSLQGRQVWISLIEACAIDPDHKKSTAFSRLLDFVLETAADKTLLIGVNTDNPDFWSRRGFTRISSQNEYLVQGQPQIPQLQYKIAETTDAGALYALYQDFLQNFDGCVQIDKKNFEAWIDFCKNSHHKIYAAFQNGIPQAFAVCAPRQKTLQIETIIYRSLPALEDLIAYFRFMWSSLNIRMGSCEKLESLYETKPVPSRQFMVHVPRKDLMERWLKDGQTDFYSAFSNLEKPTWNSLLL